MNDVVDGASNGPARRCHWVGEYGIPTAKGHRPDLGLNRLVPKRLSAKKMDAINRIHLFR